MGADIQSAASKLSADIVELPLTCKSCGVNLTIKNTFFTDFLSDDSHSGLPTTHVLPLSYNLTELLCTIPAAPASHRVIIFDFLKNH